MKKFDWMLKIPVAHRGLHSENIPENSLPAFYAACDGGYNIELDVYLLADGKVAVHHDRTLKRSCGKDIDVRTLTSSDLADCKLFGTESTIPLLSDVLTIINGKTGIVIELKNMSIKDHAMDAAVLKLLENYKGDVALQSFNPFTVKYCYEHSNRPAGLLVAWKKDGKRNLILDYFGKLHVMHICKGADFIAYNILDIDNNKYVNKYLNERKMPFLTWTVRTHEEESIARRLGANIIFEGFVPEK
jgi:glycerophosphoryl diester phosphodiesterase